MFVLVLAGVVLCDRLCVHAIFRILSELFELTSFIEAISMSAVALHAADPYYCLPTVIMSLKSVGLVPATVWIEPTLLKFSIISCLANYNNAPSRRFQFDSRHKACNAISYNLSVIKLL
jgi:hypothetical protein